MVNVANLLESKDGVVWSIHPEVSVFKALQYMAEKEVGALMVMEETRLVGILSERDYARKVALKERSSHTTLVKDIMTANVKFVSPEHSIEACMNLMTQLHCRHLPVIKDNQVIGMVTLGDVVKQIIAEQKHKISELENNITWGESY